MDFRPWVRKFDDSPVFEPVAGVRMQGVIGGRLHANRVSMAPGAGVPEHQHVNEQLGCVLNGELILTIDGQEHRLGPGMAFAIPPGVPHAARAGAEGCVVIDIFTPPRDDYPAARGA